MAIHFDINEDLCSANIRLAVDPEALEAWAPVARVFTPAIAAHMRGEYKGARELSKDATFTVAYTEACERQQAEEELPEANRKLRQAQRKLKFVKLFGGRSTSFRFDTLYPALREVTSARKRVEELEKKIRDVPFTLQDVRECYHWQLAEGCHLLERELKKV